MSDKSELLNQLKIEREEETSSGGVSMMTVLIVAALSLGGGGLGAYALWGNSGAENPAPVQTSLHTETSKTETSTSAAKPAETKPVPAVKTSSSDKVLNAAGYITARRIATVSAQTLGLITEVYVEEGMVVEKGQVLAELDSAIPQANLRFAEAQVRASETRVASIRANLEEAKRVLSRREDLVKNEFSSVAQVTSAQANVASLEANLATALADIEVSRVEAQRQRELLDDHTIRAPFAGVVTVKNAQTGEIVAPSSAGGGFTRTGICTIVDMASLEIEVDVQEAFIGRVQPDQRVEAKLDAYPDWTIPASVIAIIPTADRAKATVRVRIRLESDDTRILPDMGVKVAFLKV